MRAHKEEPMISDQRSGREGHSRWIRGYAGSGPPDLWRIPRCSPEVRECGEMKGQSIVPAPPPCSSLV
jgi:hypothetical protein